MIFRTYSMEGVARIFFNGYFFGGLFLGLAALYGFVSGAGILSTLSGFFYIIVVSLLSLNKTFRKSQFSILFCFYTFLYFNIPVAFILFEGSDYIFGGSIGALPFAQSDYKQSLPLGFLYLTVCWAAAWLGIISVNTSRRIINQREFSSIRLVPVLLLGVVVLAITWFDIRDYLDVRLSSGLQKVNSSLAFIFFDYAYLILAGLILFFKLNEPKYVVNSRNITILMSALFIAFIFLFYNAGSRAAILAVFVYLVLYPASFINAYAQVRIPFPSVKFLIIFALLALLLFYFAHIQRLNFWSGIEADLIIVSEISKFQINTIYEILNQILYRLSQGGMDQFLLIFQSFIIDSFDPDTASKFVIYLGKNTLNLVLLGTPFPEAYAPSSQLFPQVIEKNLVGWTKGADSRALIISLNTQPYTIFGIFMVISGVIAPILLGLFSLLFMVFFKKASNIFVKITMLYFFTAAFTSYGIEVVVGNSAHLFVSILLMYFIMKILSRLQDRLSARTTN